MQIWFNTCALESFYSVIGLQTTQINTFLSFFRWSFCSLLFFIKNNRTIRHFNLTYTYKQTHNYVAYLISYKLTGAIQKTKTKEHYYIFVLKYDQRNFAKMTATYGVEVRNYSYSFLKPTLYSGYSRMYWVCFWKIVKNYCFCFWPQSKKYPWFKYKFPIHLWNRYNFRCLNSNWTRLN